MADKYGLFWNSESGDRTYGADAFAEWLQHFFTTGIFTGECEVTAAGGMEVSMSAGYANIEGKVRFFESAEALTIAAANTTYPRIDTIVVRCNYTNREILCDVVQGAYSGENPAATAPVRTAEMYELVLAEIYVAAGATEITQADITDKRADTGVCGIVASTVTQIDFSQIQKQYNSFIANYSQAVQKGYEDYTDQIKTDYDDYYARILDYEALQEKLFLVWFEAMKDQLSKDAAGNLQNEIDDLSDSVSSVTQEIRTTFEADGSIKDTLADGRYKTTEFNTDGTISDIFYKADGTALWSNRTVFNSDGSIIRKKEEVDG